MDMMFYLNCPDMLDTVITNIDNFLQDTLGEKLKIHSDPPSKEDEDMCISCSFCAMFVTSIEWCPASLWMAGDDNVDVTVQVFLDTYNTYNIDYTLELISRLFLVLSRLYPGDAIFYNPGTSVVYRKNAAGLYMDDSETLWDGALERERQRRKDSVKLPFRFQTLAFPAGEDCLSINFDQGYELLTIFLVFEATNAYPAIYKSLTAVLNQRSGCKEIGLNVCSLEIHPDTTKILDDLVRNGERRCCEIATEELLFLIQIWADERDMCLRPVSKEEIEEEERKMLEEEHRELMEELKKEEQEAEKVCESEISEQKGDKKSKWKFFRKKSQKVQDEKEPQESEEQEKKRQEPVAAHRKSEVYAVEAGIVGIPERADGNYPTCFPEEMSRQEIADTIREAYGNKVRIIENAYIGRAENGMKIALFLSDAGKILRVFPLC